MAKFPAPPASGLQMVMRSFGIDPEAIAEVLSGIVEKVNGMSAQLQRIEDTQAQITARITALQEGVAYANGESWEEFEAKIPANLRDGAKAQ